MNRKVLASAAVAAVASLAGASGAGAAQIVYDFTGQTGTGGFTTGTAGSRPTMAGDFGTLEPALGPNEVYQVTQISVARANGGIAGDVDVGYFFWDDVDTSAPAGTSVFSNLIESGSFLRTIAAGNTSVLTTTVNFAPGEFIIDDPDFGFTMVYAAPGTINLQTGDYTPNTIDVTAFFNSDTGVGSSTNVFLLDVNGNRILEADETRQFGNPADPRSNVYLRITADIITIPEPATAAVLSMGAVGLLARRRAR